MPTTKLNDHHKEVVIYNELFPVHAPTFILPTPVSPTLNQKVVFHTKIHFSKSSFTHSKPCQAISCTRTVPIAVVGCRYRSTVFGTVKDHH